MIKQLIFGIVGAFSIFLTPGLGGEERILEKRVTVLVEQSLDLTTRAAATAINQGFSDNILLALHYLKNDVRSTEIDWEEIRQPFEAFFVLGPGELFAFHDTLLPEFEKADATMNTDYLSPGGYKTLLGLSGNGVCHLASLMNWAASKAGLEVLAKVKHDFAPIPEVPREHGTSIRTYDKQQNLYIKNSLEVPVTFVFSVNSQSVNLKILRPDFLEPRTGIEPVTLPLPRVCSTN